MFGSVRYEGILTIEWHMLILKHVHGRTESVPVSRGVRSACSSNKLPLEVLISQPPAFMCRMASAPKKPRFFRRIAKLFAVGALYKLNGPPMIAPHRPPKNASTHRRNVHFARYDQAAALGPASSWPNLLPFPYSVMFMQRARVSRFEQIDLGTLREVVGYRASWEGRGSRRGTRTGSA